VVSYQWQFNGRNLPGATNSTLVISNIRPADAGGYCVVATNSFGSVTSKVAALRVIGPAILVDDGNFGVCSNTFEFGVGAMAGEAIVVEASTDFRTWVPVQTNLVTGTGWFLFADGDRSRFPHRFYRARLYDGTLPAPAIQATDGTMGFEHGRFGFNLSGVAGQTVVIEASTNLETWVPKVTNLFDVVPFAWRDAASTNFARRFYRVRLN
jgi:hypothetical protein